MWKRQAPSRLERQCRQKLWREDGNRQRRATSAGSCYCVLLPSAQRSLFSIPLSNRWSTHITCSRVAERFALVWGERTVSAASSSDHSVENSSPPWTSHTAAETWECARPHPKSTQTSGLFCSYSYKQVGRSRQPEYYQPTATHSLREGAGSFAAHYTRCRALPQGPSAVASPTGNMATI